MPGSYEPIKLYSVQSTYILNYVLKPGKLIITCAQRIDIPTIEPLTEMKAIVYPGELSTIIPCIELAGNFLSEFNLTLETNEGVTVLPVEIHSGAVDSLRNPYLHDRYVLVLPRGATGVKSCKIIHKPTGLEVQHNFTFGIMPPPYNYDNALLGFISSGVFSHSQDLRLMEREVSNLKARVTALENKAGG